MRIGKHDAVIEYVVTMQQKIPFFPVDMLEAAAAAAAAVMRRTVVKFH